MSWFEIARPQGVPVVRIGEDIDAANAGAVRERLADELGSELDSLIVDLSETRYVDSAGLDMLLRLNESISQRRAALLLVIPDSSQLARLAELVGLAQAIPIHSTVASALAQVTAQPPDGASAQPPSKQ